MQPITPPSHSRYRLVLWLALMALLVAACSRGPAAQPPPVSADDPPAPDIAFTLETASGQGGLRYVGVGGDIDGVVNPTLTVSAGATVEITLRNGDGMPHDVVAPDVGLASEQISGRGSTTVVRFRVEETGSFAYWCSVPGHRAAGMEGAIVVGEAEANMSPPRRHASPATPPMSPSPSPLGPLRPSGSNWRPSNSMDSLPTA